MKVDIKFMKVVNVEKRILNLEQAIEYLNKREYKNAYEILYKLSEDKYAPSKAKLYLGIMYLQGYYVDSNYEKAYSLFEKYYGNWTLGEAPYLGLMNYYGIGVEQNYKNAWEMFHHLQSGMGGEYVINSDIISLFCIAKMYYYGNYVKQNEELANKIFKEISKKEFTIIEKDIIQNLANRDDKDAKYLLELIQNT